MADNKAKLADLRARIEKERKMITGYQAVRSATPNQDIVRSCESKIRESEKMIKFFEASIEELSSRASVGGGGPPSSELSASSTTGSLGGSTAVGSGYAPSSRSGQDRNPSSPSYGPPGSAQQGRFAGQGFPAGKAAADRKATFTSLDLIKYDTPFTAAKIGRMLAQLEFKIAIEKQIRDASEKMLKLYQLDGDKKSRAETETTRVETNQKLLLLNQALRKYKNLEVVGLEDTDAGSDERKAHFRRPLSGQLQITITSAKDLDHALMPKRGKAVSESIVMVKVEDQGRARTHPSRTDRWNEEFEINVDNANEVEVIIYDKIANENPVPVGLLWIRLNDVAEELRKRKVGNESGPGWVTAARVKGGGSSGDNVPVGMGALGGMSGQLGGPGGGAQGNANGQDGINAWFAVEPAGAIGLHLNFIKSNVRKQPAAAAGGLGRQGALRKRRDDYVEQNGHKFVQQTFYQPIKCALCEGLDITGMQCEDCKYLCHKKCYTKVVTKCISKSNADATDAEEETMLNHRIPHRFEPIFNLSGNWCCHCGLLLPPGRKSVRKCSECGLTSHTDCAHLVPDFCGMSMEMANRLLAEIKTAKSRQMGRLSAGQIKQDKLHTGHSSSGHDQLSSDVGRMSMGGNQRPVSNQISPGRYGEDQGPPSRVPVPGSAAQTRPPPRQSDQEPDGNMGSTFGDYAGSSTSRPNSTTIPSSHPAGARPLPSQPSYQQTPPSQSRPLPPPQQSVGSMPLSQSSGGRLPPGAQPPQQQAYNPQPDLRITQPDPRTSRPVATPQVIPPPVQSIPPHRPSTTAVGGEVSKSKRKVGLDDFNFLAVLGKGNFGKVMLAEEKRSSNLWAIKVLKKDFIIENDEVESTKSEKRVFMAASREKHPFLIGLHSCFQTETRIYFVMEYVSGGDLMLHIQREQFTPRRAKFYASEVLLALEYFHKNGIVYRDLKLDNILLTLDGHVKVADYGLCKEEMWYQNTTSTFCGTPEFMAPEILLEQRYGRAVDWWAFGVLIYEMLLGQSPFRGDDEDEIFDAILEDEPLYPIHMPRDSVQILQRLLTRDPLRRLGSGPSDAEEIKAHAFFRDVNWSDVYHKRIPAPYFPTVHGLTDVSNFDAEFTKEPPKLTPVHSVLGPEQQQEFAGFSYTADWV